MALQLRQPAFPWMITGLIGAVCLHGGVWFFARLLVPNASDAVAETQRQMGLGLFWMIGALALWSLKVPRSRARATMLALGCAGAIGLLGSVMAFAQLMRHHNVSATGTTMIAFSSFSLLMVVAQLVLAIPAAILLQQVVLKKATDPGIPNDG